MNKPAKFSPAAAERYKLTGIAPGLYDFPGFGEVNLETLTLDQADSLAERKFPYLTVKKVKATEDETT